MVETKTRRDDLEQRGELSRAFDIRCRELQHDELLDEIDARIEDGAEPRCLAYWQMHRDEDLAERSPGHEVSISFVDASQNPMTPAVETLSLDVMATNRDLPHLLAPGTVGGDLFMEGGGPARSITLLRKPTRSHRIERGRGIAGGSEVANDRGKRRMPLGWRAQRLMRRRPKQLLLRRPKHRRQQHL